MPFIMLETATCFFVNSDTEKKFPSLQEAFKAAEEYCGRGFTWRKIFPDEEGRLYGPGDGTTSVVVRQDSKYVPKQP